MSWALDIGIYFSELSSEWLLPRFIGTIESDQMPIISLVISFKDLSGNWSIALHADKVSFDNVIAAIMYCIFGSVGCEKWIFLR